MTRVAFTNNIQHWFNLQIAVKMPAVNIAAVVTRLASENLASPLIPCPEVHPPAILAPKTMAAPPRTVNEAFLGLGMEKLPGLEPLILGIMRLSVAAAATMPPEKMSDGVKKAGLVCYPDLRTYLLSMYVARSWYAAEAPMA
jgi:hypothetical protein